MWKTYLNKTNRNTLLEWVSLVFKINQLILLSKIRTAKIDIPTRNN